MGCYNSKPNKVQIVQPETQANASKKVRKYVKNMQSLRLAYSFSVGKSSLRKLTHYSTKRSK